MLQACYKAWNSIVTLRTIKTCRDVLFEFQLKFGIPPVLVFPLEVYDEVDRLLTSLTAQQKGTTAQWYSNKTYLWLLWH